MNLVLIAVGSALGGVLRHLCSVWMASRVDSPFPWGTILVNVVGSFTIGAIAGAIGPASRLNISPETRDSITLFLMVGVLGGYTTFSSFSLQTLDLMRAGQWLHASANIVVSVGACLVAVGLGFVAASSLAR